MDKPRLLSAKARDFTEVYIIQKQDFDSISSNYLQAIQAIRQIKDALENKEYSLLQTSCYLCDDPEHLALGCKKYSRWRGNLMKLFVSKQINSKNKFNLQQEGDEGINYDDPLAMYNNDGLKHREYFVYAEENHDDWRKHLPSADDEENIAAKTRSLRLTVKEGHVLDSHLIENIFEYPKEAPSYLFDISQKEKEEEKRREEMLSSAMVTASRDHQEASGDGGFSSSPTRPRQERKSNNSGGRASDASPITPHHNRFSIASGYEGDHTTQKSPEFGKKSRFHAQKVIADDKVQMQVRDGHRLGNVPSISASFPKNN